MAVTDAERLVVSLEARVNQFEKNFQKANRTANSQFGNIERRAKQSATRLENTMGQATAGIARHMKGMAGAFAGGLIGGVATTALASLTSNITQTVKGIAELGNEAKRAGVSTTVFQEWKFVADQNRISVDALVDGFKELALRSDEFITTGVGPAAEAFGRLGLRAEDLKRKLQDPGALMLDILGRLERFDKAAQIRISDEIFGGSAGERFVELLGQGDDALRKTIQRAHETGAVLDAEMIQKAEELDRKFSQLTTTAANFGKRVAVSLAAAGTELADFRERLDKIFPDEAQGRAVLGDELYDTLNRDREVLAEQARNVERLAQAHTVLASDARAAAHEIGVAQQELPTEGYETQKADLAAIVAEMQRLATGLDDGTVSAEEFGTGMTEATTKAQTLFKTIENDKGIYFVNVTAALDGLASKLAGVITLAQSLMGAVQQAAGVDPTSKTRQAELTRLAAEKASLASADALAAANAKFTASEVARNTATTEALRLAREVEAVRKRAKETGASLTDAQAEAAVRAAIAGEDARREADKASRGGKTPKENEYERSTSRIRDQIAAMQAEVTARRAATGTIAEQEVAVDRARIVHDLLNSAQEAGLSITPQLRAEVAGLADSYLGVEQATRQLAEAQEEAARRMEDFREAGRDAFIGLLAGSQTFGEALNNLRARLMEMAANRLFNQLWDGAGGSGSGGGVLGKFIGKIFGLKDGGLVDGRLVHAATGGRITGAGTGTSDSIPAMLSNGEYVVNASATKKNLSLLEAVNSGKMPSVSTGSLGGNSISNTTFAPTLNISVAGSGNAQQDRALADMVARKVDQALDARTPKASQVRKSKGSLLSGSAAQMNRAASRMG